jgi:hypothetical protein
VRTIGTLLMVAGAVVITIWASQFSYKQQTENRGEKTEDGWSKLENETL